jgi:hypothetical protein
LPGRLLEAPATAETKRRRLAAAIGAAGLNPGAGRAIPQGSILWLRRSSMIRFVFRLVGLLILAGGFVTFIYDGTKSIAGGSMVFTPVGQIWNNVHSTSLQLLQPAIERHVSVWLWDPVMLSILTAPAWVVLGVLGCILILIGRKKKRLIGYARD